MPAFEAPCVELGSVPQTPSVVASPSPSEISSASSPEPPHIRATPLFRALAMPPPEPEQPPGQDELERRLPGYRRIVIPRELTLIELLKQCSGVTTDEEVLRIREARLRVVAERVGLRRLHVLAPRLRSLTLDGSALSSLRDLGIGLVHLKTLSVCRCGLNSLDGVWGLGALQEFHAASNRLQDLQPLAALQKLHTLNLADNPISEPSRLWTLGVCSSLRSLTLRGTPEADSPEYRSRVASILPMLVYLDDRPLHTDIQSLYDERSKYSEQNLKMPDESDDVFSSATSPSDSGGSDAETDLRPLPKETQPPPAEPKPGSTSSQTEFDIARRTPGQGPQGGDGVDLVTAPSRRRPATTEGAGARPPRPHVPHRPRTALARPNIDAPTRLQILNTLMDDEWRCSGSSLTSRDAVCGNLARALRRPTAVYHQQAERELVRQTVEDPNRALAAEIPRAPRLEDWAKFKEETGIDIDIDFNQRPRDADPLKVIERLEQIEKETLERFKRGDSFDNCPVTAADLPNAPSTFVNTSTTIMNNYDLWRLDIPPTHPRDVFTMFNDLNEISSRRDMPRSNVNETQTE